MDELEKKVQKGLESFSNKGDIKSVTTSLDGMIDDMLSDDTKVIAKSPNSNLKWVFIVLGVLCLVYIGYQGFKDGSQDKKVEQPTELYAQYFEVLPDAISANERGIEDVSEVISDADLGMQMYNKGDFKGAASILKQQSETEFLVYGAIAEMKNENITSALTLLLSSQRLDRGNQYKDIIDWYLSLVYLKKGNIDLAKESLKAIANGNHYKKGAAQAILNSL